MGLINRALPERVVEPTDRKNTGQRQPNAHDPGNPNQDSTHPIHKGTGGRALSTTPPSNEFLTENLNFTTYHVSGKIY